jgi:hypothetical protein
MQKKIFLAFIGQAIDQPENVFEIEHGYECWNLKKFGFQDFIKTLQSKIPPVNDNVLRHYELETESKDIYGLTEKSFGACSWGLLIPESPEDTVVDPFPETMFLINLYSPTFLYPAFAGSAFGITRHPHDKHPLEYSSFQNQAQIFKTKQFVSFFRMLLPQAQYGLWQFFRSKKWQAEDWRLFVAALLFSGLRDYDNKKNVFGWQREAADMATILEALFTAGDAANEEVGYRLRKRLAVLLSNQFPSIENDVKDLYSQRSAFVHGSFFAKIAKESKQNKVNNLPLPDFNLLYTHKQYVRWALIAYLHLAHITKIQPELFQGFKNVIDILEQAIIDVRIRQKVLLEVERVLSLIPILVSGKTLS